MIVDTSALVAIVFREPGFEALRQKINEASVLGIGTPTLAELGIVLSARLGVDARPMVRSLVQEVGIVVIPFSEDHWKAAVGAWQRFGRGRHPARLNFGDCLSYATAELAHQPLLFVGDDFAKTDVEPA